MPSSRSSDRYFPAVIGLHWLTVALIAAAYATIELRVLFEKGSEPRELIKTLHFMIGLTVLVLVVFRIAARFGTSAPPIVPTPPRWQAIAARGAHVLLGVFMVAMPLLGWAILSAEGHPVPFWGLTLTPITAVDKAAAKSMKEVHEMIGTFGYVLIGAHALAALAHHYVQRDNTLTRMLPRWRTGS